MELLFLGTGTSSSTPAIECITAPPGTVECRACLSSLKPEGKKNIRRNTSAAIRTNSREGEPRSVTIVIDVGKNFQAAAIEHFPRWKLRKMDAILLSHAHADAMNGLDDLRAWTLGPTRIQDHIDIYLTEATFKEVERSFPYMVNSEFATGGGDIPTFIWHIIEDKVPFEIEGTGIQITPFLVHHGRMFTKSPLDPSVEEVIVPYLCLGFKIEEDIVYMSDVSFIPDDVWPIIRDPSRPQLPVCVLDCLHLRRHSSHLALDQSIWHARKIGAQRTYLTGFTHRVSHEEYVTMTEAVGGKSLEGVELTENEQCGLEQITAMEEGEAPAIWVRPAHDGLGVSINKNGVQDDTYR